DLADGDCDLQSDLADRLRLARSPGIVPQRGEQLLEALDLSEVPLLRAVHCWVCTSGSHGADSCSAASSSASGETGGSPSAFASLAAFLRSCFSARFSLTACSRFSFSNVCRDFCGAIQSPFPSEAGSVRRSTPSCPECATAA